MIIIMMIIDFNTESIVINAREIDKRQVSLSNDICYTKLKNWKGYRFQDKISNWKLVEMQLFLQRNTYRVTLAKFSKHSGIPAGKEQKDSGTGRGAVEEGGGEGGGGAGTSAQEFEWTQPRRLMFQNVNDVPHSEASDLNGGFSNGFQTSASSGVLSWHNWHCLIESNPRGMSLLAYIGCQLFAKNWLIGSNHSDVGPY